jgi:hypothetical protein
MCYNIINKTKTNTLEEENKMAKYNSVENAERFLKDQIDWCLGNGYNSFSVWSNGEELQCVSDDNDLTTAMRRGELKSKGYWRAFRMVDGHQVSVLA